MVASSGARRFVVDRSVRRALASQAAYASEEAVQRTFAALRRVDCHRGSMPALRPAERSGRRPHEGAAGPLARRAGLCVGRPLEVYLQVREDEASQRVVYLRIGVPVEEGRRQAGRGKDRRVLVHDVVDPNLQLHTGEDLIAADEIEIVPASGILERGIDLSLEEWRGIRGVVLGISDVPPAGLQPDTMPRGRPA